MDFLKNNELLFIALLFKVTEEWNKATVTSPCAHAPYWAQCTGYVGMSAPVTKDVAGHRALKYNKMGRP